MMFKKIKLKNIRSYRECELEFPQGSFLLSGDIGSGKTSILLAIEYALFGLQPGQRGSALLRNNADFGEVYLEFELDGHSVVVERKLKRSQNAINNDYSAITVDGDKLELSATELKTRIINLLGYPSEFVKKNNLLYRYTVYTPQEHMKQVILEDAETRLNMLRHIFGVDKYRIIRENLAIVLNYLKEESKIMQGVISTLDADKSALEELKNSIKVLNEIIKSKEIALASSVSFRKNVELEVAEIEKKIKERELLEKEVEKTGLMISTKHESIYLLNKERGELIKALSSSIEFKESDLIEIISKISIARREIDRVNLQYSEIIGKIRALEQKRELDSAKKQRIFKIDICPTCLQNVPEAHKHNIMNETESEMAEIKKQLEVLEREKIVLSSVMQKHQSEVRALEENKSALEIIRTKFEYVQKSRAKLLEVEKSLVSLNKDVSLLAKHNAGLKENILKFSTFIVQFRLKQDELKRAFLAEKNLEIEVAEMRKENDLTHKNISNLESQIKAKEESKKRLFEIMELSSWLSSHFTNLIDFIERNVLIKLRAEFSKLFSKWFHMLAGDSFEVHLDESFTPVITQGDAEMDYSFLSGGERTSIALAYRLALNQTVTSVFTTIKTGDIIILDEPTDGFSDAQLDKMRDVFNELVIKQLIIVSHEAKIENYVDSIIKIQKDADSSQANPLGCIGSPEL
jgi:exonuclease SbcC